MQTRESRIQAILAKVHSAHQEDNRAPFDGRVHIKDRLINNARRNGVQDLGPAEAFAQQAEDIINDTILAASCCFISDDMLQALEREGIDEGNSEIYTEVYSFMVESEQHLLKALANTPQVGGVL